jgi:hypothetical protein
VAAADHRICHATARRWRFPLLVDWLILIVAVPAIIVPIVLLFGFSGCGLPTYDPCSGDQDCGFGQVCTDDQGCVDEAEGPSAPEGLHAVSENDHSVLLTWTNTEPAAIGFEIQRALDDGDDWEDINPSPVDPAGTLDTDTKALKEGLTFIYRVSALVANPGDSDEYWSNTSSATVLPAAPTNLTATVVSPNRVDLKWINKSTVTTRFQLVDQVLNGSPNTYDVQDTTYSQMNPVPGDHTYQVSAVLDGFEDSVEGPVFSEGSNQVMVSIMAPMPSFAPAFTAPAGTLTTDRNGHEGYCVVQRLASTLLIQGGTQVRMTLRGSTTGSLTLDRVTISQVAASGDPYDSALDLVTVATAVTLAPNIPQTVGPVSYVLDPTKDLLIAFDVSASSGQGNLRNGQLAGADSFTKHASEAAVPDRAPGYASNSSNLYLIDQIEVA